MLQMLMGVNAIMGLLLFFFLSDITSMNAFESSGARVIVFIVAAMLLANTVYLAFGNEAGWFRRR
jgi:hypothetical protein